MANWALALLTLLLVVITGYYAYQTQQMVAEMRRQNRPYVYIAGVLDFEKVPEFELVARNGGNRVAIDIKMFGGEDVPIWRYEPQPYGQREARRMMVSESPAFRDGVSSIAPGESKVIGFVRGAQYRAGDPQALRYRVTYRDGGEATYEDNLSTEYRA